MGDYVCHNVAWLHLTWVGVFALTPNPPTCTFWPLWDWHGEALYWQVWQIHTVRERWSWPVHWLHLVGGGHGHPPPPFDWVMHAHCHLPTQESKFNHNFKIKLQTYFQIFSMVTYFCVNNKQQLSHHKGKILKVINQIFMKLLPIHGLK